MDISPRKPCKRIPEPVDEWLNSEGYFRKHAPRDPTCLFRAVSEQIYLTQHFHLKVREECVKYMRDNKDLFEESISIPFESYLEQMSYFTEWGGVLEMKAMSLLYQSDIIVFNGQKLCRQVMTDNGFEKIIYLCHIPPKQYETVYEKEFISTAAFCQSIVYQMLYKDVFGMTDVDDTVFKMLHDRSSNISHEKFFLKENLALREQLTVELFNKLDKNGEENEDFQTGAKSMTPFPYRIAKALDPNIYRNTDFDIWHEIKREIKNAGWMKYNGSDLQVGGKCLVHMDTKEDELDHVNNNSSHIFSVEEKTSQIKDNNGNEPKIAKRTAKKDPLIYSGHIQEMTKDEGPVVVFIEELGEKKTVPYSSLKPITQKKNRQSNWSVMNHKKNNIFDSGNQRWKKTNWYGNTRKIKDLAMDLNSLTSNEIDKNNNKVQNQELNQWDNESRHSDESSLSYKTYTMEQLTAYQGYAVNTSIDVMPVSVVLDNPHPSVIASLQFEPQKPEEQNPPNSAHSDDHSKPTGDVTEKQLPITSASTVTQEMISHPSQNCNRNSQSEIYYPAQTGIGPYHAGTGSVYYPATDCNIVPSAQFFVNNGTSYSPSAMDSLHSANQAIQSVNTSAPRSVEPNFSDLPLSDLHTLRFFYNLGIEYFRANCGLMGCGSSQAIPFGTYYIPPGNPIQNQFNNPTANNSGVTDVLTLNEEVSQASQNFQQKLVLSQQHVEPTSMNREFTPNNGKVYGRTLTPHNHGSQKLMNRDDSQNVQENKTLSRNISSQQSTTCSPNVDKMKESPTPNKDNQRSNRNALAPRFKKNFDGRYRNSRQQQHHQQHQHQQQQQNQQQQQQPQQNQQQPQQMFHNQQNLGNIDTQTPKNIGVHNVHNSEGQSTPPHNPTANTANTPIYQNTVNQIPFSQPPMYAAIPYYPTDTESAFQNPYYPSNQNFSVPYIPHSDITEGNNVNHYPPNIYQGSENYGQPYPLYPQYMYPPGMYPTISSQNTQENWYPLPGQTPTMPVPHYIQYSPTPTSLSTSPNGPPSSNVSK